jgi:hypothetical protein
MGVWAAMILAVGLLLAALAHGGVYQAGTHHGVRAQGPTNAAEGRQASQAVGTALGKGGL